MRRPREPSLVARAVPAFYLHFIHCYHTRRKRKIRTLLQSETGSDFSCLMGASGLRKPRRIRSPGRGSQRLRRALDSTRHPAGRSPNSSSLFLPLAAVVAVAQGLFSPPDGSAGRCCSNPPSRVKLEMPDKTKNQRIFHAGFFGGAKQPKSEPLPSGASLAAISSKVMVFVPSL